MMIKQALFATALAIATSMATGQLVINEIMRNPFNVKSDRLGEWFELYNPSDRTIDIDGWIIEDDGTNYHEIDNGGPLLIAPKGYLVLGNNADTTTNGGVKLDYEYPARRIFLNNGDDELVLAVGSAEIDRVNWDGSFPNQAGAAMALRNPALDNNIGANWCNAVTTYGNGDKGTPGGPNDCPVPSRIVINEIMRNPMNVKTERAGEWFELYNPNKQAVDINGWTIRDDGTNDYVINNGGPLEIAGGGYLVLGNNKDTSINGGVTLDYEYDAKSIFLNNAWDELVLLAGTVEIDRVNWDGGVFGTFPNTEGAAMALMNPNIDNNVGKSWCDASTVYGFGDKGTPGAANDCKGGVVDVKEPTAMRGSTP